MTGWQGGGGGQDGNWNPQQDPYGGGQGGQYGADPYGGGYNPDPYGRYNQDPYGQYGGTAMYPAYQPAFEPPPPKRSKAPIVLSIVAILAVVGTVVTIVLLNRSEDPSPAAGPGPTSSPSSRPSAPKLPTSSRRPPTSKKPAGGKDGWITIDAIAASYQVPGDWKKDTQKRPSGLGVEFDRGAVVGNYECEGATYFRGFTAYGEAQSKDGSALDLNKTVTDFASAFAKEYYRNPKLEVPEPKPATVGGAKAASITVKLTVTPSQPACEATSGEVALVGVPIEKDGEPSGVRMLVVVNDLAGGPGNPAGLPDALAEEILTTFTIN
ncbi:MAG TPA: hypothetical protein VGX25_23265 [Actinophytocola sp.]|uniref:hypothetical protein n=1 Tax=Actinophytocola sp. TaxID=1872138 RepID=UPI002DDCBCC8|nr:hypothetical protein [Actinophytocola sp.]HEV2782322.1 hypothetical protein [Actinophytocola sp.]